jgi:hypothetical protein
VYLVAVDPRWTSVRRGLGDDPAGALAAFAPVPGSAAVWQGEGAAPFAADDAVVALAADPLGLENLFLVDRWGDAGRRIGAWPVVLAVRGIPLSEASTGAFAGAFGDLPGERFLLYAEAGSGDGPTLYRALRAAGAERILGVSRDDGVGWAFLYEAEAPASGAAGGAVPGAIERRPLTQAAMLEAPLGDAAVFSLSATPPVLEVLRATEVVPPGVWNLPHTRRIRYFRTDDQRQGALRSY